MDACRVTTSRMTWRFLDGLIDFWSQLIDSCAQTHGTWHLAAKLFNMCVQTYINKQYIKLNVTSCSKKKITLFFTPCASFLGLPARAPNPPKRGAGFFYHHMAQHRKGATRAYQSRSPREAAKNAKKGKHEKRYPYRGFLFRKKKHTGFQKTR